MNFSKSVLLVLASMSLTAQTGGDATQFSADGELALPKNYREWVFLSSGLSMTYGPAAQATQGDPSFENVFVNPASYRAFLATGTWPEKTMFILEIRKAAEKGSINNGGHYQTDIAAIEAEVKDSERFPQKWAFFAFGKTDKVKALAPTSSCNQCHSANGAVDNTFVQFYPTLLDVAAHKGTLRSASRELP